MDFTISIPAKHITIATHNGHNVTFADLQLGKAFTCEAPSNKTSTYKWRQTETLDFDAGITIILDYFFRHILPKFNQHMPDLPASAAFEHFVTKTLHSNNLLWNQRQWQTNTVILKNKGAFK